MTTARLADVGARDPHPPVLGRRLDHATQQLAVARLQLVLPAERDAGLGDAVGKRVAHALELVEAREPRAARRCGHARVDLDTREGLGGEAGQLALQPSDLAPQLSPGEPLVAAYGESLIADSKPTDSLCWCLSLTQARHPRRV